MSHSSHHGDSTAPLLGRASSTREATSGRSTISGTTSSSSSTTAVDNALHFTFTTAEHGVVSVNVDDLSTALGVRRDHVVPQHLHLESRSAPSYATGRSLLESAAVHGSRNGDGSTTTVPAVYQRRHSTLRGTALPTAELGLDRPATPPLRHQRVASFLDGAELRGDGGASGNRVKLPATTHGDGAADEIARVRTACVDRLADTVPLLSSQPLAAAEADSAQQGSETHSAPLTTGSGAEHATDWSAPSPSTPRRRVHFSEDVIASISVARRDEDYMHLLVVYGRPWYAYALLVVFGVLLGCSMSSLTYISSRTAALDEQAVIEVFLHFLQLCGVSVGMLCYYAVVGRSSVEEDTVSPSQRALLPLQLPGLWGSGAIFFTALSSAIIAGCCFSFSFTTAATMVVVLALHLVLERLYRENGGDAINALDVIGCLVAVCGALCTSASDVLRANSSSVSKWNSFSRAQRFLVIGWWVTSVLVAGVFFVVYTRRLRRMSQQLSQLFLLVSTMGVSTVVLGSASYILYALLSADELRLFFFHQLLPLSVRPLDVFIFIGGVAASLAGWCIYHRISFYVDHVDSVTCLLVGVLGAATPLPVKGFVLIGWAAIASSVALTSALALLVGGELLILAGAAMILFSGFCYRRQVEIRIVME